MKKKYDGKNHDAMLRWLVREGRAVRGGVHPGGPGDTAELHFEDHRGNHHQVRAGHTVHVTEQGAVEVWE